jgi:hypothetical protein
MNQNDHSVNVGRDNYGQAGQILTNCSNIIQQQSPGARRSLLEELEHDVRTLIVALPSEKKEEVAGDFEMLLKGATATTPNRRWYECSAGGLLEAAKWVNDFSGNIAGVIRNLGKSIWPDFSLSEGVGS